jgi:hypothetical protein
MPTSIYTFSVLVLVLQIEESTGNRIYPAVISTVAVRYEDESYIGDYENVVVRAENGSVLKTIDIQVVE